MSEVEQPRVWIRPEKRGHRLPFQTALFMAMLMNHQLGPRANKTFQDVI